MDYKIWVIDSNDETFKETCNYIEENITIENLVINGGTLNYHGLTYQSEVLILISLNDEIIGYNSLVVYDNTLYVYQIAVKKEYQQKGIGTLLMEKAIELASSRNMDVTANVMEYNTNSKNMFLRLGFTKLGEMDGNGYYRLSQPSKKNGL